MKISELFESSTQDLKYENPKGMARKAFNKVMGIPQGKYMYKVGDVVEYEMYPAQKDGAGTGKITKLLDGHHYLINGKPVNQNEIKGKASKDEVEEGMKSGAAALAMAGAVAAGIAHSPKVEINGTQYDKAISSNAPADAKMATVDLNGKKTKVLYWDAKGPKFNRVTKVYTIAEK